MKASASPSRATIQRSEGMVIGTAAGDETGTGGAAAVFLAMSSFTSSLLLLGRHVAPAARFHGPERLCSSGNVGRVNWRSSPLRVSRRHYPFGGRNGAPC